jgi:uncharacterized membrane protein SpoIIM required for sporulation
MSTERKRKVAFALLMGIVTTGIITFSLLALNVGFSEPFVARWVRSWGVAYVIMVPVILDLGPLLQSKVDRLFD